MTMLDDDRLASLLARAGDAFEVPASGAEAILARAAGPARAPGATEVAGDGDGEGADDGSGDAGTDVPAPLRMGRVRHLTALADRHRILSAAACLVVALIVAGTVGALVRTTSTPTLRSGLPPVTHAAPPSGATTTIPQPGLSAQGTAQAPSAAPFSTNGNAAAKGAAGAAGGTVVTTPTTAPSLPGAVGKSAKIEQTGTLGLAVARHHLGRTMTQLAALAGANDGFVASSQTQSGGGAPYGTITLQVPVDSFSSVLKQAQALGRTSDLTTKATDVTGQYVDLQSRIAALQDSRQQYLTILSRATTVGDVLAVQQQLDSIQSQIEQLQGQLQVLTSETAYSTLTVNVSEGTPVPRPGPLPESGLVRAWHDSIGGFVAGVEGVVRLAGPVLFALLCLAALVVGGRALWRRYQRHNL